MAYDCKSALGRADRRETNWTVVAMVMCVSIVAMLGLFAWLGSRESASIAEQRHDSLAPTYTYDGEVIRWYVFVDPDTSIQYLVNDRGGCTPRLDRYGEPIGKMVRETD